VEESTEEERELVIDAFKKAILVEAVKERKKVRGETLKDVKSGDERGSDTDAMSGNDPSKASGSRRASFPSDLNSNFTDGPSTIDSPTLVPTTTPSTFMSGSSPPSSFGEMGSERDGDYFSGQRDSGESRRHSLHR
jgi:hypothetical protein